MKAPHLCRFGRAVAVSVLAVSTAIVGGSVATATTTTNTGGQDWNSAVTVSSGYCSAPVYSGDLIGHETRTCHTSGDAPVTVTIDARSFDVDVAVPDDGHPVDVNAFLPGDTVRIIPSKSARAVPGQEATLGFSNFVGGGAQTLVVRARVFTETDFTLVTTFYR